MKKVLITGITGFVGYHLLRELRENEIEIWALCRQGNEAVDYIKEIRNVHIIDCNLAGISQLPSLCKERDFDVFYHLAWSGASGTLRGSYDVQLENIKWTCNCVETAKRMRCRKIVITGTVCEKQCDAILRQGGLAGSAYYLLAKKYANEMTKCIGNRIELPVLWCQFYHPIGIFNKKEQIIANTIQMLLNNKNPRFGLAQGLFDVVDVRDLAHALYLMGEKELSAGTYFVGSGTPKILKEYLEIVRDIVNPAVCMGYGEISTNELPMEKEWLDISSFQAETGFMPTHTFHESIREMQSWMEDEGRYDSEKWII